MSADQRILQAVLHTAEVMFADVAAHNIALHDGMAYLIADTLGIAVEPDIDLDTANELVTMCSQWALQRRHAMQADLTLMADPVPDDVRDLLEDDQEQA